MKRPEITVECVPVKQGKYTIVVFALSAKELWNVVKINKREDDPEKGYQRTLSTIRTAEIAKFIDGGNAIPTNIVVAFEKAKLSGNRLTVPVKNDSGWVIDGQHRLAGAYEAKEDIELCVTAFLNLTWEQQIAQFVTINREAKKVPTSLYYDLLPDLVGFNKSDSDIAKERAVDIANTLRTDEDSVFFNRITSLTAPGKGQISLTNFVRKVYPLVQRGKGKFHLYTEKQQRRIIDNYFTAVFHVFAKESTPQDTIFFKTLGFGALMNALPFTWDVTTKLHNGFAKEDVLKCLKAIDRFDFSEWRKLGTGNAAEILAGQQICEALTATMQENSDGDTIRL